jgi:hypothetical protein
LALDDAIAELAAARRRRCEDSEGGGGGGLSSRHPVQLCTMLPYKWLYAYSDDTHELYALFDPKLYVTVADVENAAERIRAEHLPANGKC